MYKVILLGLLFISIGCKNKANEQKGTVKVEAKKAEISVYDFNELEPLLYTNTDTTYVVNFWAMWCAPCVKELPYFLEYAQKNKGKNTEVIFVSMDFAKDLETKLKPFLKSHKLDSHKVVLLDDPDANTWINKIDPNWSGAIPFTIVFNKDKRQFFERSFENLKDLENTINNVIN